MRSGAWLEHQSLEKFGHQNAITRRAGRGHHEPARDCEIDRTFQTHRASLVEEMLGRKDYELGVHFVGSGGNGRAQRNLSAARRARRT